MSERAQLDLFVDQPVIQVHAKENNPASQKHLDENRTHFNRQCRQVFDLLMKGEFLTTKRAVVEFDIMDLVRRIADLRESKVSISDRKQARAFIWFMTDEDKAKNQKFIQKT